MELEGEMRIEQCPRCGTKGASATPEGEWIQTERDRLERFVRCGVQTCRKGFIVTAWLRSETEWVPGGTIPATTDRTRAPEGTPELIAKVYGEARRAQEAELYNAACTSGRAAMEHSLAEQGHGKGKLYKRIESARAAGLVTDRMAQAINAIREVGNMGTHEATASKEDAELTLDVCEQVLKDLYETPLRLSQREAALAAQAEAGDES